MNTFCTKCGNPIQNGAAFCPNCGTPVEQPVQQFVAPQPVAEQPVHQYAVPQPVAEPQTQTLYEQPAADPVQTQPEQPKKKMNKGLIIGIVAGVAAVLVAVIACLFVFGGNGPEDVANEAIKAVYVDHDIDKFFELMHEDILEDLANKADMTVEELKEETGEMLSFLEKFDYDFSWEIGEVFDADYDEFKKVSKSYRNDYGLEVEEVKYVNVTMEISGTMFGESMDESTEELVPVLKIDGKWYLGENADIM